MIIAQNCASTELNDVLPVKTQEASQRCSNIKELLKILYLKYYYALQRKSIKSSHYKTQNTENIWLFCLKGDDSKYFMTSALHSFSVFIHESQLGFMCRYKKQNN